uniref:TMF_TATA_bd domain-containing protein n=1 Tax=Mesocestoides corti TaxID=53468 RepID=A0A5K3EWS2_MESCO
MLWNGFLRLPNDPFRIGPGQVNIIPVCCPIDYTHQHRGFYSCFVFLNLNVLFSDFIQMKAHLRAKEAECQVLRDEVVRLHSKNSPAVAMPTESSVQPSKPHHKQKPVSTASKHVQCDMVSANSAKAEATATPPPPVQQTTPSMDSLVIKTLQEEIARLAQENTLLTQRQANLEGRLETSKRLNAKLQSEAHKAGAEAAKKAEATVRQQMDDVIKKLRAELTETSHLLRSKTAQLELTEQTNETNAQNLHHIQAEYNEVVEANNALKQEMGLVNVQAADAQRRLGESLQMLANLEKEHEAVLQQLAIAQSSLQTEVNSGVTLRHRLAETEAQLEATCSQSDHLKADLVNTQCQLTSTKQALAELKENYDRDLSALTTRVKDLEAEKEELLKAREQEVSQAPQPQSPVETPEADASSSSGCAECAVLAAEVERFTSILAVTEVALSQLQLSVDQEESRWRSALQESSAENAALKSKIDALTAERDQALEECNENHTSVKVTLSNGLLSTKVIENGDACSGEHNFSPSIVANGGTSSTVENHSIDIA